MATEGAPVHEDVVALTCIEWALQPRLRRPAVVARDPV